MIKRDTREALLEVVVLDVDLDGAIPLVLQELCDRLVDLRPQHLLRVSPLLIVRLTVIVHISPDNIVADQG